MNISVSIFLSTSTKSWNMWATYVLEMDVFKNEVIIAVDGLT